VPARVDRLGQRPANCFAAAAGPSVSRARRPIVTPPSVHDAQRAASRRVQRTRSSRIRPPRRGARQASGRSASAASVMPAPGGSSARARRIQRRIPWREWAPQFITQRRQWPVLLVAETARPGRRGRFSHAWPPRPTVARSSRLATGPPPSWAPTPGAALGVRHQVRANGQFGQQRRLGSPTARCAPRGAARARRARRSGSTGGGSADHQVQQQAEVPDQLDAPR